MTDHCDSCPWRGCATCEFQGGVDPANVTNQLVLWDNETAPAGNRGLTTSPAKES